MAEGIQGPPVPSTYVPPPGSQTPAGGDYSFAEKGPTMLPTGGSSQSSSSSGQSTSASKQYTPVTPPVLDILAEMRARRESKRAMYTDIVKALLETSAVAVPEGSGGVFPGMEKGGMADILMGIMSGQGAAGAGVLDPLRKPGTMSIPISAMQVEQPSVADEFGGAMGMSKQILDAIKVLLTGESVQQSTQQSAGGGGSWSATPWEPSNGEPGMDDILMAAIFDALFGGQQGTAQGVPASAGSLWGDESGNTLQGVPQGIPHTPIPQ